MNITRFDNISHFISNFSCTTGRGYPSIILIYLILEKYSNIIFQKLHRFFVLPFYKFLLKRIGDKTNFIFYDLNLINRFEYDWKR